MKTTLTSTLRLLAAAVALGFTTNLCASVVELEAGRLDLSGELEADRVIIGSAATLTGDGTLVAATEVAGIVSPGSGPVETIGTLTFTGALAFSSGSRYLYHTEDSFYSDLLIVSGAVTGSTLFIGARAAEANPNRQRVIEGGIGSDYALVVAENPTYWNLRVEGDDLLLSYGRVLRGTMIKFFAPD